MPKKTFEERAEKIAGDSCHCPTIIPRQTCTLCLCIIAALKSVEEETREEIMKEKEGIYELISIYGTNYERDSKEYFAFIDGAAKATKLYEETISSKLEDKQ